MEEGKSKLILEIVSLLVVLTLGILAVSFVTAGPGGADLTEGPDERGSNSTIQSVPAQAGNVSALNIDQKTITGVWQGFFGNVSGQVVLQDASSNNFYDWENADATGEIFATRTAISDWTNINCTNSTHWEEEEDRLSIPQTQKDGINETFRLQGGHPAFLVGNRQMQNCWSARPYNSSGTAGDFWNVLLSNNASNIVYTSIIEPNANAFDDSTVDFELLVPVNRSTGFATYWFYAELD